MNGELQISTATSNYRGGKHLAIRSGSEPHGSIAISASRPCGMKSCSPRFSGIAASPQIRRPSPAVTTAIQNDAARGKLHAAVRFDQRHSETFAEPRLKQRLSRCRIGMHLNRQPFGRIERFGEQCGGCAVFGNVRGPQLIIGIHFDQLQERDVSGPIRFLVSRIAAGFTRSPLAGDFAQPVGFVRLSSMSNRRDRCDPILRVTPMSRTANRSSSAKRTSCRTPRR